MVAYPQKCLFLFGLMVSQLSHLSDFLSLFPLCEGMRKVRRAHVSFQIGSCTVSIGQLQFQTEVGTGPDGPPQSFEIPERPGGQNYHYYHGNSRHNS
jgi:hypothetical protein